MYYDPALIPRSIRNNHSFPKSSLMGSGVSRFSTDRRVLLIKNHELIQAVDIHYMGAQVGPAALLRNSQ